MAGWKKILLGLALLTFCTLGRASADVRAARCALPAPHDLPDLTADMVLQAQIALGSQGELKFFPPEDLPVWWDLDGNEVPLSPDIAKAYCALWQGDERSSCVFHQSDGGGFGYVMVLSINTSVFQPTVLAHLNSVQEDGAHVQLSTKFADTVEAAECALADLVQGLREAIR
jgi:hypothetical protein